MKRYLFAFGPNEEVIYYNNKIGYMKRIYNSGLIEYFYLNDKLHRIGLPAFEGYYGAKHWLFNGKSHKINGVQCNDFQVKGDLSGCYRLYDKDISLKFGTTNLNISRLVI